MKPMKSATYFSPPGKKPFQRVSVLSRLSSIMAAFLNKIFNPPMNEINFESFIKFPMFAFRLLFFVFDPLKECANVREKLVYYLRMGYFRLCLFQYVVAISSLVVYCIDHSDDFIESSSNVPNVLSISVLWFKALIIFYHKEDIWKFCQELKELFDKRAISDKKNIKICLDNYHRSIKVYAGTFVALYFTTVFPIFLYMATGKMIITVKYYFPFDIFRPIVFPLILLWVDWIAFIALVLTLAADALIFSLVAFISTEFSELNIDFLNIKFLDKNVINEKIASLIDRHNKLLDFGENLQNIFGSIFFITFVITSINICFTAFQLSITDNLTDFMFFVPYICLFGGQTYLLCFFGQKLIDSSELLADGVYNCGWEEFDDIEAKKKVILMILRAQRPKKLTAMKFADVSFETYATVSFSEVPSSTINLFVF